MDDPSDKKKAPTSHNDATASAPGLYLIPDTAQLRDECEDDFLDLVGDSQRDEQSFVIAREIAEINADELRRSQRKAGSTS